MAVFRAPIEEIAEIRAPKGGVGLYFGAAFVPISGVLRCNVPVVIEKEEVFLP